MSKIEALSLNPKSRDFFSALIAEAWLDPKLSGAIQANKLEAITAFARHHGIELPDAAEIEAFEVPANPVGDLEIGSSIVRMDWTTAEMQCTTEDGGCHTAYGCPSGGDCGPWPSSICPSEGCPSTACSYDCATVACSALCYTMQCTVSQCDG